MGPYGKRGSLLSALFWSGPTPAYSRTGLPPARRMGPTWSQDPGPRPGTVSAQVAASGGWELWAHGPRAIIRDLTVLAQVPSIGEVGHQCSNLVQTLIFNYEKYIFCQII